MRWLIHKGSVKGLSLTNLFFQETGNTLSVLSHNVMLALEHYLLIKFKHSFRTIMLILVKNGIIQCFSFLCTLPHIYGKSKDQLDRLCHK